MQRQVLDAGDIEADNSACTNRLGAPTTIDEGAVSITHTIERVAQVAAACILREVSNRFMRAILTQLPRQFTNDLHDAGRLLFLNANHTANFIGLEADDFGSNSAGQTHHVIQFVY